MKKRIILSFMAVLLAFSFSACNKNGNKTNSGEAKTEKSNKDNSSLKENPASDFKYTMTDDGTGVKITKYIGKSPKIIIPATIESLPVLEVTGLADKDHDYGELHWNSLQDEWVYFKNNVTITHIVFPDSVRSFGGYNEFLDSYQNIDLSDFDALEYVKLPAGLLQPDVKPEPGITLDKNIKNSSIMPQLYNCDKLKTVIIPEGLKVMPDLSNCISLESITLPSTICQMGSFEGCTNLKEIIIPDTITSIVFDYTETDLRYGYKITNTKTCGYFEGTNLPLATQAKLKQLGYEGKF